MKLLVLAVLSFTTLASAYGVDYSLCNDAINNTFKKDKNFPYGFVQLNSLGEIEAAPCSASGRDKRCAIKNFDRATLPELYVVTQASMISTYKPEEKTFKIVRDGMAVTKIISGQDELQFTVSGNKCVAKTLVSDIPEENVREMSFDILSCKTFYEIEKKYGQKLSDCFSKDIEFLRSSSTKNVMRIGTSCQVEMKEVYKNLVSLKWDIITRYANDLTLKRKPFDSVMAPAVFNDQVIENFICTYEDAFLGTSGKKECTNSGSFEVLTPTDTSLGTILGNKKTCGIVYSDATLSDPTIFKQKGAPDSMVYTLDESSAGSKGGSGSGSGKQKGKNQ